MRTKRTSKRASRPPRLRHKNWRLWMVAYPFKRDRVGSDYTGVLITDSSTVPLPVAFVSNNGVDAVKVAVKIIRGTLPYSKLTAVFGADWVRLGTRLNSAILQPLDPLTGKLEMNILYLAAARIFVDPLDHGVCFHTMDARHFGTYLQTQRALRAQSVGIPQATETPGVIAL